MFNSIIKKLCLINNILILNFYDFTGDWTFQYKITFNDITNLMKEKESNKLKNYEVSSFSRKLNVLFCYYNELGDGFSFVNSDKKEENKN